MSVQFQGKVDLKISRKISRTRCQTVTLYIENSSIFTVQENCDHRVQMHLTSIGIKRIHIQHFASFKSENTRCTQIDTIQQTWSKNILLTAGKKKKRIPAIKKVQQISINDLLQNPCYVFCSQNLIVRDFFSCQYLFVGTHFDAFKKLLIVSAVSATIDTSL